MVVFPSDFEGFGLPVVEGMLLGVPVVIGPEPATIEIAGGHAVVIEEWTSAALADAVTMAGATSEGARRAATVWARGFTWDKTVRETRRVLEAASGSGNDH